MVKNPRGLFCANFANGRGPFPPCHQVWCGPCYQAAPEVRFPVQERPGDVEDDELVVEEVDKDRYMVGRNGDHLMDIPFFCELCSFRNLEGRNPEIRRWEDRKLLAFFRRANLDAFWSREPGTVSGNMYRAWRDHKDAERELGMSRQHPRYGCDEVHDFVGMGITAKTLLASLWPG